MVREKRPMSVTHPHLVEEFDSERNAPLTPESLVAGTNKKLHWICKTCSHQWTTSGNKRAYQGTGCPSCSGRVVHSDGRNSISITHPKLAEEFDIERNAPLTPDMVKYGSYKKVYWRCSDCSNEWLATPNNRTALGRGCPVCSNQAVHSDGRNSLRMVNPKLSGEFDIERNAPLTPETVVAGTNRRLHWICSECSHKWIAQCASRNSNGRGCPACSNKVIHNDGRNSMQRTHTHLASEFDIERNFPLTPSTTIAGTNKKLYWICGNCAHNWIASGNKRVGEQTGCPSCAGNELHSDGRNSMRKTHPHLAREFDMERNAPLTPDSIKAGTNKGLHWICSECSHRWVTQGNNRIGEKPTGCPACAPTGFQPELPASYYVIEIRNEEGDVILYKGGISNNTEFRFTQHKSIFSKNDRSSAWKLRVLEVVNFDEGTEARVLETRLLKARNIRAPNIEDVSKELFLQNPLDYARERKWV